MRCVIQRVSDAEVRVDGVVTGKIHTGLLILFGVRKNDQLEHLTKMVQKILNLRIFNDDAQKMNLSVLDVKGEILVVSQFTLYADAKKGNRPSYIDAAPGSEAEEIYNLFVQEIETHMGKTVQTGQFAADMKVRFTNDGPVTIILDSEQLFKS